MPAPSSRLAALRSHLEPALGPAAGATAAGATTAAAAEPAETGGPEAPLDANAIAAFDKDGFVNSGAPLLTEREVQELSDVLDEIIDRGPEGFGPGEFAPVSFRSFSGSADIESRPNWQIVNTWEAAEAFHRLIFHPKIVGAVAQLTRAADLMVRIPASALRAAEK